MKVLHVVTVADSLVFLTRRSAWMAERGVRTEVVCSPDPKLASFGLQEGVVTHAVSMRRAVSPVTDAYAVLRLLGLLRSRKPDIVHAHTPKGGLLGMVASWLARIPVRIYHIHGLPFQTATGLKRRLLMASEWLSCRLATDVMAVSESILVLALDSGLCPRTKGLVLVAGSINGVDTERFSKERVTVAGDDVALRARLALPDSTRVVGFVGRLVRDKGVVTLVEAWGRLRGAYDDVALVLVGPWEDGDPVPEEARKLLLDDDRVFFTGFMENPASAYALMTVLTFPSRREGFGLAAIEAGAMGVPVIAADVHGLRDAVKSGATGVLIPRDDPDALARALEVYLDNPDLAELHGKAGQVRARTEFVPEEIWGETLEIYRARVSGTR